MKNSVISLLQFSDNDKKLMIAFVIFFVIIIALFAFICIMVSKVSIMQGKKVDDYMHEVTETGAVKDAQQFKSCASKKNFILFYRQARLPLLLVFIAVISTIIYCASIHDWNVSALFNDFGTLNQTTNNYEGGRGISTLMYLWDYANIPEGKFLGITVWAEWPALLQVPHFEVTALFSYIAIPVFFVGGIWFLIVCQAFLARTFRIFTLARKVYEHNLENTRYDNLKGLNIPNSPISHTTDQMQNQQPIQPAQQNNQQVQPTEQQTPLEALSQITKK